MKTLKCPLGLDQMTTDGSRIKYPPPAPISPGKPLADFYALTAGRPVIQAELPDGSTAWLVSGYEQVRQVFTDQRFSRALATTPGRTLNALELSAAGSIVGTDGPEHLRLRKLVAGAFTARRVEAMRPRVAAIVDELIDALTAGPQPADLMASFCEPLPVRVICEMLGVPTADMAKCRAWSSVLVGTWEQDLDEVIMTGIEVYEYLAELISIKRTRPGDDLLDVLIAAHDSDDRVSEAEIITLGAAILLAGFVNTTNLIGLSLVTLLDHPAELARLRADPGLIPGAVEEMLRYVGINVLPLARVTTENVDLGGVTIPADEMVLPLNHMANRDPSAFGEPDRFNIRRAPASHLAFGTGPHRCLGAPLARVELQESMRALVTRLPGLALAVPTGELRFKPGMAIHALRELPITWTAAASRNLSSQPAGTVTWPSH
jgi:cytochrome P450